MESMRNDLRGALDEGYPEAIQASTPAAAAGQQSTLSRRVYEGCSSRPTPGTKLRYCGRCEVTVYSNEPRPFELVLQSSRFAQRDPALGVDAPEQGTFH